MDIHSYIDANKQQMVASLKQLLRIPSVEDAPKENAPFGTEVRRALDCTLTLCASLGLEAVNVDGYAGYAEISGAQGEQIGVLTHLDVVPASGNWTYPPFDATERDGVIWARGICDDKAPAVASIYALAALKQSGIIPKRNIRLIFGCNEESGWGCIDHYDKVVGLPEVGFSPDADYPIINTEKGIYHATLTRKTGLDNISISGGERPNVVMPKVTAVINGDTDKFIKALLDYDCHAHRITANAQKHQLVITAEGQSAHASTPQNGKNALFALVDLMRRLPLNDEASKLLLLLDNTLCNKTDGSGVGLNIRDDISGALTLNVGIISLENGLLSITLDVRYPVTFEADLVRNRLAAAFDGFSITDEHIQHPHHTPEDHFLVRALKKVYQKNTGQEAQCLAIGGGTYARALKTGVAFGVTRPGAPEMAHNCDERMSIDDFIADAHMFADAYLELVNEV